MTKKSLYSFLYLFVLFLVYAACLKVFTGHPYFIPQLVLLSVIVFATREEFVTTLWYSFAAGFLLELFSGLFFGANLIPVVAVAMAAFFITRNLTAQQVSMPSAVSLVILGTALFPLLAFLYLLAAAGLNLTESASFADLFSWTLVWTAVMNMIFFYPVQYAQPISSEKYN